MTTQIRRTRIAAALAVGMLAGSMFGPAVADAARRVVADDVSCTTPCVQDAEIVGVHGSKVSGTVGDADTLDGLDAAAFIEQAYAGDHEIGFPDPIPAGGCRDASVMPTSTVFGTDHLLIRTPSPYLMATGSVMAAGNLVVVICNVHATQAVGANGTYRITALQ